MGRKSRIVTPMADNACIFRRDIKGMAGLSGKPRMRTYFAPPLVNHITGASLLAISLSAPPVPRQNATELARTTAALTKSQCGPSCMPMTTKCTILQRWDRCSPLNCPACLRNAAGRVSVLTPLIDSNLWYNGSDIITDTEPVSRIPIILQ